MRRSSVHTSINGFLCFADCHTTCVWTPGACMCRWGAAPWTRRSTDFSFHALYTTCVRGHGPANVECLLGVVLGPTSTAFPSNKLCFRITSAFDPTSAVLEPTRVVVGPLGFVIEPTEKTVFETTGAVMASTGTVSFELRFYSFCLIENCSCTGSTVLNNIQMRFYCFVEFAMLVDGC